MSGRPIQEGLSAFEHRREFLDFQVRLLRLEKGDFSVLDDNQFMTELVKYLSDLYNSEYNDFAHRVLHLLSSCTISSDESSREKALLALSYFTELSVRAESDEAVQALSWTFLRWLQVETKFLASFEAVCNSIMKLLTMLVEREFYYHFIPWLGLFDKIIDGRLKKPSAIRVTINRHYTAVIDLLLLHGIPMGSNITPAKRIKLERLYQFFSNGGSKGLVRELFISQDRKKRLALIATLSSLGDNVVKELIDQLPHNCPWYMIRNVVQITAAVGNSDNYDLVRPFLAYPDVRVQKHMVEFISILTGEKGVDQRLHALDVCDDRLKPQLIAPLAQHGGLAVELALVYKLGQNENLGVKHRNQLLLNICKELRHFPTSRVVAALKTFIKEHQDKVNNDDPVLLAAQESLVSITQQ